MKLETISSLFKKIYAPSIRGMNSKKSRQRKKSYNKWKQTPIGCVLTQGDSFMEKFKDIESESLYYKNILPMDPMASEQLFWDNQLKRDGEIE
jgi:hypothetical protein